MTQKLVFTFQFIYISHKIILLFSQQRDGSKIREVPAMDKLYELMYEKHVFINYKESEITDISRSVHILLTRLIGCYNNRNKRFFITRYLPGGSMVEMTRIWENQHYPMIEFDFLVLLQYRYEAQHVGYGCPGHLKLLNFQTVKDDQGRFVMTEEEFRADDVVKQHNEAISSILEDTCKEGNDCTARCCENDVKCRDVVCCSDHTSRECATFRVDTDSGWLEFAGLEDENKGFLKPIVMKWHSNKQTLIKPDISKEIDIVQTKPTEIKIMADFIPGFQFSRSRIPERIECNFPKFPKNVSDPGDFFLVPKLCPKQHPTCWRISYCATEVQSMSTTHQKHRDAYKMIKVFKNYALENTILSTYFMKSVVLRHIDHCDADGPEMQPCLVEMLEYTLECFERHNLPHFVLGHDLFENRVFFQNTKQEEVFLKNFKKLVSDLQSNRFQRYLSDEGKKKKRSLQIKDMLQRIALLLTNHRKY